MLFLRLGLCTSWASDYASVCIFQPCPVDCGDTARQQYSQRAGSGARSSELEPIGQAASDQFASRFTQRQRTPLLSVVHWITGRSRTSVNGQKRTSSRGNYFFVLTAVWRYIPCCLQ